MEYLAADLEALRHRNKSSPRAAVPPRCHTRAHLRRSDPRGRALGSAATMGLESAAAQKLDRKLQKVERKRVLMQSLVSIQILLGPPLMIWVLHVTDGTRRSALAASIAGLGFLWSLAGVVGLYAVSMRRVQSLAVFTAFEMFLTMLSSCAAAALLLLHHLNCWEPLPAQLAAADAARQPWARCPNVVWLLLASALMVLYLAATASEALALRLRIQKTGKRNLDWNTKPQRRLERNVRRGASPALRALAPHLKESGDSRLEEDSRLKLLSTHDKRYIARSLLLLFPTVEGGEPKRLLLNLRKGYIKHGGLLGTKIYLSQVTEVRLDEDDEAAAAERAERMASSHAAPRRALDGVARCVARLCAALSGAAPASDAGDFADGANPDTLYSCVIEAQRTTGWLRLLFGLKSRSHTTVLDFRRPDERKRFLTFVVALLPPSIRVSHASGGIHGYSLDRLGLLHSEGGSHHGRHRGPPSRPISPVEAPGVEPRGACGTAPSPASADASADAAAASSSYATASGGAARAHPSSPLPMLALSPSDSPQPGRMRGSRLTSSASDEEWSGDGPAAAPWAADAARGEMLSLFVGSWNMGDANPPAILDGWIGRDGQHDLYAVSVQECEQVENWLLCLETHLGPSYVRVSERRMGGIALIVFTHRRHASKISGVETSFTPTGVLGVGTNKGAVALTLSIRGVRICVVNAHLAASQDAKLQRNQQLQQIAKTLRLGTTALELPVQFHTFWCGDLNYRIDEERLEVLRLVEERQWHALYTRDQLANELAAERVLFGFAEPPLAFAPTYKYARLAGPTRRRPLGLGKIRLPGKSSPQKMAQAAAAAAAASPDKPFDGAYGASASASGGSVSDEESRDSRKGFDRGEKSPGTAMGQGGGGGGGGGGRRRRRLRAQVRRGEGPRPLVVRPRAVARAAGQWRLRRRDGLLRLRRPPVLRVRPRARRDDLRHRDPDPARLPASAPLHDLPVGPQPLPRTAAAQPARRQRRRVRLERGLLSAAVLRAHRAGEGRAAARRGREAAEPAAAADGPRAHAGAAQADGGAAAPRGRPPL